MSQGEWQSLDDMLKMSVMEPATAAPMQRAAAYESQQAAAVRLGVSAALDDGQMDKELSNDPVTRKLQEQKRKLQVLRPAPWLIPNLV